ncbi:NAD-dependent epimerase/dehydratase family protein [Rubellimicrobium roseum]|uniref:NAD-dependent epimerase/dehydratase family protein n=1 Tax=Rubellimicrobium roseum TaxID=687525 RepID=UPI0026803901
MHVLILGTASIIGRKLATVLVRFGVLNGTRVTRLMLADASEPEVPAELVPGDLRITTTAVDMAVQGAAQAPVAVRPDLIFHLAAIVSAEAEADFEKGYSVNIDGTRALFEAIRMLAAREHYRPCFVFTFPIATFDRSFPQVIEDDFIHAPQTSYGTQKAIWELLLDDYSRRGILDGVALRMPTICIRPGRLNRAALGFSSSVLREPLLGQEAVLPVDESLRHWHASPRGRWIPPARSNHADRAAGADHAWRLRHGGRADRGSLAYSRRSSGGADPARTRSCRWQDHRGLAGSFSPLPSPRVRISSRKGLR